MSPSPLLAATGQPTNDLSKRRNWPASVEVAGKLADGHWEWQHHNGLRRAGSEASQACLACGYSHIACVLPLDSC